MEASTRLWGMCVVRSSMRCGCLCKKVITCHRIVMASRDVDSTEVEAVDSPVVNVDDGEEETQASQNGKTDSDMMEEKPRKLYSKVWSEFNLKPGPDKRLRAYCKKCDANYLASSHNGTGNLERHLKACKKRTSQDVGQMIFSHCESSMKLKAVKFDHEVFRELINVAILKHNLPFSFVEYSAIREAFKYAAYANQEINLVSRNTAKADILKMYTNEKIILKKMLQSVPGRISLTSDLWTSMVNDGYLSLTGHFIGEDGKLKKILLNYSYMPTPHTGIALCEKIHALLIDWGIEKKLFSVTLDNASSNDSFVGLLRNRLNLKEALVCDGDFLHVRCCAHVVNLIVQKGLDVIDGSVIKVRESVRYFRGSQGRKKAFKECVTQVGLRVTKGLKQDVPTRWNSTYLMLDSAIYYRQAFDQLSLSDSNYRHCPSQEEWIRVEKTCEFLSSFYYVTCTFSGRKYPTANLYLPEVYAVKHELEAGMNDKDLFIKNMACEMVTKFEKYWSEFNQVFVIAAILDPRYKMKFVEYAFEEIYGKDSEPFKDIKRKLYELFDIYLNTHSVSPPTNTSRSRAQGPTNLMPVVRGRGALKAFEKFDNENCGSSVERSQLDLYLLEPRMERTVELDILSYWKTKEYQYRELAMLARDLLSIPVSTVASEAAFSIGGKLIDP